MTTTTATASQMLITSPLALPELNELLTPRDGHHVIRDVGGTRALQCVRAAALEAVTPGQVLVREAPEVLRSKADV